VGVHPAGQHLLRPGLGAGLILVFYGAFEIVQGVASRPVNPMWWVNLIMGILLVLLAFWVSGSDRGYALAQRTFLICSGWA
jgi:hypothetical protein